MKTLTKILAAIAAIAAGVAFFFRGRARDLQVRADVERDRAEALPMAAVVAKLERKVAADENATQDALGTYDSYRATHPIDGDGDSNK